MHVSTDFISYNFEGLCGSVNSYIREHTSWHMVGIRYHLGKYFSPKCKEEKAKRNGKSYFPAMCFGGGQSNVPFWVKESEPGVLRRGKTH